MKMVCTHRFHSFFLLFFFLYAGATGLSAGRYELNGTNYTSGVYTSVTGVGTLASDATGIWATGGSVELTISGLILQYGTTWETLNLTISNTGGTLDVAVRDSSGYKVLLQTGVNSSVSFDLTKVSSQISQSRSLQLIFTISPNVKIENIQLNYSGNSVYAYPSPYHISVGFLKITYDLAWDAKVNLVIYDNAGKVVKKILTESLQSARNSRFTLVETWDGLNDDGVPVSSGIYTIRVSVRFVDPAATVDQYQSSFRFLVLR